MTIPLRCIEEWAALLQGVTLDARRAGELAIEIDLLNGAIRTGAGELDFDTEPAAFSTILAQRIR